MEIINRQELRVVGMSRDYRRELARRLDLRFTDEGRHRVPATAGGSSFDGRRFHGDAARMPVFDRWRHYRDDPAWRARFDRELLDLAEAAFGRHPELAEAFDELAG